MTTKSSLSNIRQTLIGVLIGGLVSIVPFYFETKAMTLENSKANLEQDVDITVLKEDVIVLDRNVAVEITQRENNGKALERIEKKIDALFREVKH